MAKELPYFKFEPNQWDNGNIQICSREDKGLFLDLCSMYWSRLGDVPLKLAVQKLCGGNASAFDSLIQEEIFIVEDGLICIDFLNEQLSEFENTSKQNSKNAKERWLKHRKQKEESERNASASIPQYQSDAIREEKIREEEQQKKDIVDFEDYKNQIAKEGNTQWMQAFYIQFKLKDKTFSFVVDDFILHLKCNEEIKHPKTLSKFKSHLYNWCNAVDPIGKLNKYKKHQPKQNGQL